MSPARPLLWVLALWAGLALPASLWPAALPLWQAASLVLLLVAGIDALRLWRLPALTLEREVMQALPLGSWSKVGLRLHNPGRRNCRVAVHDHHPQQAEQAGLPAALTVPAGGWAQVDYRVRLLARGPCSFEPAHLLLHSPLGLWRRRVRCGAASQARVYPNFAVLAKYTLLAADQRLGQMGIRKKRRRGEGLEFHQLREYREGDALRQIDWRASARMRKLIARDYQDERDQQVVFLLDCGRRMRSEDGELSHFDHCLNAVLLLAHVALRQGDAVGLLTFGGEVSRWVSPRKSMATLNLLLNAVYDLQPSVRAPDYSTAAMQLLQRHRRRALVVLISNLRDEDTEDLLPALDLLRRRHLVLVASLREKALDEVLREPVHGFDAALEHAAIHHYLAYRRAAHQRLSQAGVLTLDARAAQLPVSIVNRYLEIKSSGRL